MDALIRYFLSSSSALSTSLSYTTIAQKIKHLTIGPLQRARRAARRRQWSSDLRHPKLLLGEELRERGADKEGAASGRDAAQARARG